MLIYRRDIGPFRLFVINKDAIEGEIASVIMHGNNALQGSWTEDFTDSFKRFVNCEEVLDFILFHADTRTSWE